MAGKWKVYRIDRRRWHHRGMLLCRFIQRVLSLLPVIALAAGPAPLSAQSSAALPGLGDGTTLSPVAERRLGDSIVRHLYRDPDYLPDWILMEYVQSLWQPLLQAARQRGEALPEPEDANAWEILLSRERTVNAFALPGGYMGLHLGLVGAAQTRAELASVLAHELTHVTQRHIARNMARQSAMGPWVMGALVLGVLAASKGADNAQGANAAIVGSQALAVQSQLNYSRDMEREADRIGFAVLQEAGFSTQGFVDMFAVLQQSGRLTDGGSFPYLRSHPLTTERMADMQSRIGVDAPVQHTSRQTPDPAEDWVPRLMSARARVLAQPDPQALAVWFAHARDEGLASQPLAQQAVVLYGATLAAMQVRDWPRAVSTFGRLYERCRGNPAALEQARWLGAELALAVGDTARALSLLAVPQATGMSPSRTQVLLTAQARIRSGASAQVVGDLRLWLAGHPRDAGAWRLVSQAYAALGNQVASVRAEGEISALEQDSAGALDRMLAAQDLARAGKWGPNGPDYVEASIVDSRARTLAALVRQQALER